MAGLLELLEAQQDTADELLVLRPQVSQAVKKASRPRRLRHATQYRSLLPHLVLTSLLRPQAARASELERELGEARRQLRAAGVGEEREGSGEA